MKVIIALLIGIPLMVWYYKFPETAIYAIMVLAGNGLANLSEAIANGR